MSGTPPSVQAERIAGGIMETFSPPTRRAFCVEACRVASLAAIAGLAACRKGPTSPSNQAPRLSTVASTVSGRVVSVAIDAAGPLGAVGGAASAVTSIGTFLIARNGPDAFAALSAICTHQGCVIDGFDSSRFVCPCHGSQYSTSGVVTQGPADRALATFATQFAGGVLSFTA